MNRLRERTTATLLIAIFMISAFAVAVPVFAQLTEVWVDDSFVNPQPPYYLTIQEGIEAVDEFGTVNVAAGTYSIGWSYAMPGYTISKAITLQGEDRDTTIIDGLKSFQTIKVTASDVTITGFTFSNSRYHDLVTDTSNTQSNIILSSNVFERIVQLYSINNLEFSHNQISGFSVWQSSGTVSNNEMGEVLMGIALYGCDGLMIKDNTITARVEENTDAGIHIQGSTDIKVHRNTITGFDAGPRLYYSHGTRGAGVSVYSSDDIDITRNDIEGNTVGVYVATVSTMGSPENVEIHNNDIEDNDGFGVLNCKYPVSGSWNHWEYGKFGAADAVVNARANWWGDPAGPDGAGDSVSDNVDFDPWHKK